MPKTYFLTFGGGEGPLIGTNTSINGGNKSSKIGYHNAVKRLAKQANDIELFDYIYDFTEVYIKNDKEFWSKHKDFIVNNHRIYGYGIWKGYLIMKTMEKMEDGDILLYADSGCILQNSHKEELKRLFKIVDTDLIIASLTCNEQDWSKMDLIKYLNMENSNLLKINQRQSSAILFKKCKETLDLVKEWYNISCNYHMIDDSPSIAPNVGSFKEHRHDQSVFSLLTKKYNIFSNETINKGVYIARFRRGY